jgi:hypothetical protein
MAESHCVFFRAGVAANHGSTGASPEVTSPCQSSLRLLGFILRSARLRLDKTADADGGVLTNSWFS